MDVIIPSSDSSKAFISPGFDTLRPSGTSAGVADLLGNPAVAPAMSVNRRRSASDTLSPENVMVINPRLAP